MGGECCGPAFGKEQGTTGQEISLFHAPPTAAGDSGLLSGACTDQGNGENATPRAPSSSSIPRSSAAGSQEELRKFLQRFVDGVSPTSPLSYMSASVDLSGDGVPETLVYLMGDWCGSGGCTMLVLQQDGGAFRVVSQVTIVRLPIRVFRNKTNGWRDIGVWVQGGGETTGYEAVLPFDGSSYAENPSAEPARRLQGNPPANIAIAEPARP
jgi:hypothetical protein